MTALKRIVTAAYETTDGQTFASKDDAAKHQAHLNRLAKIGKLVADQFPHSADDLKYLDAVTVRDVALFIVQHADELREILPKRAKAAPEKLPEAPVQGVQVGSPVNGIGALAANAVDVSQQPPVVGGVTAAAPAAFSFPVGLSAVVGKQEALANA